MGALLGGLKKNKSRVSEVDRQVLQVMLQRDQLVMFSRKLESECARSEDAAKQLLSEGKKSSALLALKRRKQQMDLIHQTGEQLLQVNQLISNIEVSANQVSLVKALEAGNSALRNVQAELNVDYVSTLLDQNSELQQDVQDIGKLLSGVEEDDPSVYQEFKRIEAEVDEERGIGSHEPIEPIPEILEAALPVSDPITTAPVSSASPTSQARHIAWVQASGEFELPSAS